MVRLLLALCLVPFVSMAAPSMQSLLSQEGLLTPVSVMEKWEQQDLGTICGFNLDIDNEQLVYLFSAINTKAKLLYKLEYNAADGQLLAESSQPYDGDSIEQLHAVSLMLKKNLTFSSLINLATQNKSGHLIQAELDHDLSISYLELKLLNQQQQKTIAFDIENLRPLPLLKWD
ncbi:hypothetical protein HBH39_00425 [Shewanella aestuarii]|uniref:Outer membrane lipoprotein carrier protein LolA n=2 Tax=Shewanella aestuarii TaxID=1028752 RepID=A0A6G9QGW3_9GAMM|nr:hypothetical protein HBH39_00425 [Shewanella aestuarii]